MTKLISSRLQSLLAIFVFLTISVTNLQAAAPSSVSGWTFFVQITEGAFGFGKSGSFLLCLSDSGSEYRMVSLSNLDDTFGTYTYQASGTDGTVTMGNIVMTFSFLDNRRGNFGLIRDGAVLNGYQLGVFSAGPGTQPDSISDSIIDFVGRRVDMPGLTVNYRMRTQGNSYSIISGTRPTPWNVFGNERINKSTTRLTFTDSVLGTGSQHLIFTTPTSGIFAYKIGSGKAYEKGSFRIQEIAAPEIVKQPEPIFVLQGERAEFSVEASGTQPLEYQWFKDNAPIPGANQPTYVVERAVHDGDVGFDSYTVRIRNMFGSVDSEIALLEVVCKSLLSKSFDSFDYNGGTGTVDVTSFGCSWHVDERGAAWISYSEDPESNQLTYTVPSNSSPLPRTGFLRIGTQKLILTQQGAPAPDDISGMTLRLDGIADLNFSPFYYFTTLTGTNRFFGVTQAEGTLADGFAYTYDRTNETTGFFRVADEEYRLEFDSHGMGNFAYTNSTNGSTFTGNFTLSESRLDGNFDGFSDLAWLHSDGRLRFTSMFGTNGLPDSDANTNKYVRPWGIADINGDAQLDVISMDSQRRLIANLTNVTVTSLASTNFVLTNLTVTNFSLTNLTATNFTVFRNGTPVPAAWRPVTVQDLDNDGHPDLLFQNKNGKVSYWRMVGTNFTRSVSVRKGKSTGINWLAVASADMNMDRQQDIIFWNNANHQAAVWLMNDGDYYEVQFLAGGQTPGAPWRLRGVADMDYDGHNDLLWQNATNGVVQIWHLNGIEKRVPPEGVDEDISIEVPASDPKWILIGPK